MVVVESWSDGGSSGGGSAFELTRAFSKIRQDAKPVG